MAIDVAPTGILQGQVDWHCWSSAMPPHIFLSALFFLLDHPFSPDVIDGCGTAGIYVRLHHLPKLEISYATSVFFGVRTFFFWNALFSPNAINGRGHHRYFARLSQLALPEISNATSFFGLPAFCFSLTFPPTSQHISMDMATTGILQSHVNWVLLPGTQWCHLMFFVVPTFSFRTQDHITFHH